MAVAVIVELEAGRIVEFVVVATGVAVVCILYTSQEKSGERVIECNKEQHEIRNAWSCSWLVNNGSIRTPGAGQVE